MREIPYVLGAVFGANAALSGLLAARGFIYVCRVKSLNLYLYARGRFVLLILYFEVQVFNIHDKTLLLLPCCNTIVLYDKRRIVKN